MDTGEQSEFARYREAVERPLLRMMREYGAAKRPFFYMGLFLSLIERLVSLTPPLILGIAIDGIFTQETQFTLPLIPQAWIPETQFGQFWFSVGLIMGAFLLSAVLQFARGICLDYFSHHMMHTVRTASYEKLQRLDMQFFDEQETGEIMSILNNDVSNFERFFDQSLGRSVRLLAVLVGVATILFYLNWQLAIVTFVAVPILTVFTLWFMHRVEPVYSAIRGAVGKLNTRLENNIGGIQLIKTATTEPFETERVRTASKRYFETNWKRIKLDFMYNPGTRLISNLSFVLTFIVGGYWLFQGPPPFFSGGLTVGAFVTFLFMSQRFTGPLKNISTTIDEYENALASGKRVFGLMDMPVRIKDKPDASPLESVEGEVTFDDVDFGYSEDELVIEDFSLDVEPGQTIGLVGPTGAGKSTILKLLMRLYDVNSGSIMVDGQDIRDVRLADLRGAIGYVSQHTYLFGGTIEDNIRYGRFDADKEDIIEAAKMAEAHEFITNLPEGYDSQVGERGVRLSGGQRQRISIARTITQDPEILIFDEATSSVDTETEMLIQRSLDRLSQDRTTFVIAHRLSTIKDADEIVVLEEGKIVERGTHDELLAAQGLYANLWMVQAGEIDSLPEEFVERASDRRAQIR